MTSPMAGAILWPAAGPASCGCSFPVSCPCCWNAHTGVWGDLACNVPLGPGMPTPWDDYETTA